MKNTFRIINLLLTISTIFTGCKKGRSPEEIYKENINKVVELKTSIDDNIFFFATGCYIKNGYILTNKHVVYNSTYDINYEYIYYRKNSENDFVRCYVDKISDIYDLALLKTNESNNSYYNNISEAFNVGEQVYTIGNPIGLGLSFSSGNISSELKEFKDGEKSFDVIQTSFCISEGNSGGPIFNANNELLGIVSFRILNDSSVVDGVAFGIPSKYINAFIL